MNNFSQKAKRQILDSQQGKKRVKEPRDPQGLVEIEGEPSMREAIGVDVSDWRLEKNGDFGCFIIDKERQIEVL